MEQFSLPFYNGKQAISFYGRKRNKSILGSLGQSQHIMDTLRFYTFSDKTTGEVHFYGINMPNFTRKAKWNDHYYVK